MSSEKRLLLAIALSTIVIVGWSAFFQKKLAPAPEVGGPDTSRGAAAEPAKPRERRSGSDVAAAPATTSRRPAREAAPLKVPAAPVAEVSVETVAVSARISSAGGRLVSWQLKAHRVPGGTVFEELVPLRAARADAGPLSVRLSDLPEAAGWPAESSLSALAVRHDGIEQRLTGRATETVVVPRRPGADPEGELVLTQRLPAGRTLVRRLRFSPDGTRLGLTIELDGAAPEWLDLVWAPGIGLTAAEEEAIRGQATYQNIATAMVLAGRGHEGRDQKFLKQAAAKEATEQSGPTPFWAAVRNKYFAAALLPPEPAACEGVASVRGIASADGTPDGVGAALRFQLVPGARRVRIPVEVWAGPQEYRSLDAIGQRMVKVMDLGWFGWLAVPMIKVLHFLAGFVHNYGVAIIVLTVLVRGAFWFPSQWGMNQMKKLQEAKPQIDFINAQYKDDPKRKQEEMMRIYRERGVNPLGGCLPMLLQIPVFIALYSALAGAIELRGAEFIWWIRDLSAKDPIYVLPTLVGATMWLQQSITPVVGDPAQAKMMKWMSLAFAFMFFTMPSGLTLYFLAQNVIQIAQQWHTNRQTARPAH